jgi:hypothetical protein
MRVRISTLFGILALILLIFFIYLFFIKEEKCNNELCFRINLRSCERASYSDGEWFYRIIGKEKDSCVVYVKNIYLKEKEIEISEALKGKDMKCNIPLSEAGFYMPIDNIEKCSGPLKEAILDLMVKKMHLYIIKHIGEINATEIKII